MKRINLLIAFIVAGLLSVGLSYSPQEKTDQKNIRETMAAGQEVYRCPMHAEVISDKPGKCPKCGMDLEKKQRTENETDEATSMCARMCNMMMKSSSMMKMMHEQMMEGMNQSLPDSTRASNVEGKSCCAGMMKKK